MPTDFWQAFLLSPGAVAVVALFAAIVTFAGIGFASWNGARDRAQKEQADFRAAWWDRAEWALEKSLSADERIATFGYEFLERLTELITLWAKQNGNPRMADVEARLLVNATVTDLNRAVDELGVALESDTEETHDTGGERQ